MESTKRTFSLKSLSLFRLGALVWAGVTFLGYYFYRTGGSGLYKEGYSLPAMLPMGVDFNAVYSYAMGLRAGIDGYISAVSSYPPFVTVVLLPFTLLPPGAAYRLYVVVLLAALCCMLYASLAESGSPDGTDTAFYALVAALFMFFSYPVNFALERGNSDLVAGAFSAASLLYMTRGRFFPSVLALVVATQFKLYPAVLIALLFRRFGYRALAWFLAANAAAFLMLGVTVMLQFAANLKNLASIPALWEGNHSLYAYAAWLAKEGFLPAAGLGAARNLSYAALLALFGLAWLKDWLPARKHPAGSAAPLCAAEIGLAGMCFCLMCLLPSVSYDYKLAILAVPFLLLLTRTETQIFDRPGAARLAVVIAAALTALALLPRNLVARMKTPWLLLLFALYFYLALKGNRTSQAAAAGGKGAAR